MIQEIENFYSFEECNNLIDYFKNNFLKTRIYNETIILPVSDNFNERNKLVSHISEQGFSLNYDQIVLWVNNSKMDLHVDGTIVKDNEFTSICYLNNNYVGGRTFIKDRHIESKIGKLIFFNSKNLLHGVEEVQGARLTYIAWWKQV